MSATFDSTTKAAYDAATTAQARAEAIVASLTGTISVKVFDGSNTEMGSGTMAAPWATASAGIVTLGEVSSFTVGTTATPDADWYIRFENSDASRWARGSFGLADSGQDYTWSLATWTEDQTGTIGTATIIASGNSAPAFTVAPTTASIGANGGTIQFTAVDPDGSEVVYGLTTTRAGITISPTTGLVAVTAAAAGTSGNIVVQASDGILTASATCAVTVADDQPVSFTIAAGTSSSTFEGNVASPGQVIEFAAGTHGPRTLQNLAGTALNPIIVRSAEGGQAIIRRSTGSSGGFVLSFRNCHHVIVDGSYTTGQTYGIKVMNASSGTDSPSAFVQFWDNSSGLVAETPTENVTIRYVEVDGAWAGALNTQRSIGIQFNDSTFLAAGFPGVYRNGLVVEYCQISNVEGEGIYMGPNFSQGHLPIRDCHIRYNTITNTGWDGIQMKMCTAGTNTIHHNTVTNVGRRADTMFYQHYGVAIDSGQGDIYANWIADTGHHGIQVYTNGGPTGGPFLTNIYNNLVIRAGAYRVAGDDTDGIVTGASSSAVALVQPAIYNNTVGSPHARAVDVNSTTTTGAVRNNLVIDSTGVSVPSGVTAANNPASATFVNAGADDYRLAAASLASGSPVATTDYAGTARPLWSEDCGAYEYI